MKYTVILEKGQDSGYVAYVPALRGAYLKERHAKKPEKYQRGYATLHSGAAGRWPACAYRGGQRICGTSRGDQVMPKLPRGLSGREVRQALEKAGFYLKRQKGSHMIMRRDEPFAQVVVPDHKGIDPETLSHILNDADISVEEFIRLL